MASNASWHFISADLSWQFCGRLVRFLRNLSTVSADAWLGVRRRFMRFSVESLQGVWLFMDACTLPCGNLWITYVAAPQKNVSYLWRIPYIVLITDFSRATVIWASCDIVFYVIKMPAQISQCWERLPLLYAQFGGDMNEYFELKNSWGADGVPQTRTTC